MDLTLVRHVDHGTDAPDLRIASNVRFQVRNNVKKEGIFTNTQKVANQTLEYNLDNLQLCSIFTQKHG